MRFFAVVALSLAAVSQAKPLVANGQIEARDIAPQFVCAQDSDCVERNVGNCCGYYPMCANANAVLPHPCPDGGEGVCGFPTIDSCKCGSKGGCMSLQGDNIVHGQEYE
ncbi:hypothetical protein HJFPF1_07086 [Paramyrothecium foliicola]|nr:hypothetical protein HJFPF1_07086 [Paramyrothecium foliicola]